jgi:hypothetical protein
LINCGVGHKKLWGWSQETVGLVTSFTAWKSPLSVDFI